MAYASKTSVQVYKHSTSLASWQRKALAEKPGKTFWFFFSLFLRCRCGHRWEIPVRLPSPTPEAGNGRLSPCICVALCACSLVQGAALPLATTLGAPGEALRRTQARLIQCETRNAGPRSLSVKADVSRVQRQMEHAVCHTALTQLFVSNGYSVPHAAPPYIPTQ